MARHAAVPAMDRRSVRLRRTRRRSRIAALGLAALLAASAAVPLAVLRPWETPRYTAFDTTTAVSRASLTEASRSESRATPSSGSWFLGSDIDPDAKLTVREADNKTVQALINGRDEASVPAGFDPDHADGDTGNAYEFSQCTWWAYVRRHQLGLPAGSHMGNGADWADTARRLGYRVDFTPRVGDVICFARGQYGSDATYGHVGIVENVGADGSITTSECGSAYDGKPFSRTFTAEQASQLQFIHY